MIVNNEYVTSIVKNVIHGEKHLYSRFIFLRNQVTPCHIKEVDQQREA